MTSRAFQNEILIALCEECKCCLASSSGHCWVCHTTATIRVMCGCGDCPGRAESFMELEKLRSMNRKIRYSTKKVA